MLTERQLELAARKLCELRGHDPEKLVGHGPIPNADGSVNAVYLQSPRWILAKQEIMDFINIQRAIEYAKVVPNMIADE